MPKCIFLFHLGREAPICDFPVSLKLFIQALYLVTLNIPKNSYSPFTTTFFVCIVEKVMIKMAYSVRISQMPGNVES
jgi:hypothetical protein